MFLNSFHAKKKANSLHSTIGEKGWKSEPQWPSFPSPRNVHSLEHIGSISGEGVYFALFSRKFSAHCHSVSLIPKSFFSAKSKGNSAKGKGRVNCGENCELSDGKWTLKLFMLMKTKSTSTSEDNSERKKLSFHRRFQGNSHQLLLY